MKIDLIVFEVDYIKWATIPRALATIPSRRCFRVINKIDNLAIGTFEWDLPNWKVDHFERATGVGFALIEGEGIGGVDRQVVMIVFVSKVDEPG